MNMKTAYLVTKLVDAQVLDALAEELKYGNAHLLAETCNLPRVIPPARGNAQVATGLGNVGTVMG